MMRSGRLPRTTPDHARHEDKGLGDLLLYVTIAGGGVHVASKATDKKYRKKPGSATRTR